ncbi:MAG: SapC family protein [Maricaulaceae bacterium]
MAEDTQTDAQNDLKLAGQVPLYKNPEPLSVEKHGGLGIKTTEAPYQFLAGTHFVPIAVTEFGQVAPHYPIIFAGETKTPLAVMGARAGENIFVTDAGRLEDDVYVPAFVRRYPFVLANAPGDNRMVVCVDTGADAVSENPQQPFFEDGKPTKFTNDAMEFLKTFERDRLMTERYVEELKKHDLFEPKDVTINAQTADGQRTESRKIADYFAVSEKKIAELGDEPANALRRMGMLGPSYAHLISLFNWSKILNRTLRRAQKTPATA